MSKLLKLGALSVTITSPVMTVSCAREVKEITTITFDAGYEDINYTLIDTKLNLEKFIDKELLVAILNVNGDDVYKYGYLNEKTILLPGQEELVNIIDWVKYIVSQTPSGEDYA